MKKLLLLVLLTCLFKTAALGQVFEWAKSFQSHPPFIATDGTHLVSASLFGGTINFGTVSLQANGNWSNYVAKHNNFGSAIWAKKIIGRNTISQITTDPNGNIIITGFSHDSISVDGITFKVQNPLPNSNRGSIFVAKFTGSGNLLWIKLSNTLHNKTNFLGLDADPQGNIYLAYKFYQTISFDNYTANSSVQGDFFIMKFDSGGNGVWLRNFPILDKDYFWDIKCGKNNDVYIHYVTRAGGHTPSGNLRNQLNLKKYSTSGNLQWHKTILNTHPQGMALDSLGNIYLSGTADTTLIFDNISLPRSTTPGSNHIYFAKITPSGNWAWVKKVGNGNYRSNLVLIGDQVNGLFSISGLFSGTAIFGNKTYTTSYRDNVFTGKIDTTGNIIQPSIIVPNFVYLHGFRNPVSDAMGNTYVSGSFGGITFPISGTISLGQILLSTNFPGLPLAETNSYIAKISGNSNELNGTLFIDTNGNGLKDSTETGFKGGLVEITPGPGYAASASNGTYTTYLPAGSHHIKVIQPSRHYNIFQNNITVTNAALGQTIVQDFALTPIPGRNDVKIAVTNLTPARPGFALKYRITFQNVATTTLSDTISLTFNASHLTFNTASITPVNQQPGKLKWFYQALGPNETRNIDVEFTIAATTPLSTPLQAIATIKPIAIDLEPSNNTDTLNRIVTGAYDPNDKLVNYARLTPKQLEQAPLLDYTIRFQNTGTDTAFTVIVLDSISENLFMPSFEMLSASHPYTFKLLHNGMAEWRFDNILLPDSNRNEPASHGFIRYRMQAKPGLRIGDQIKTRAGIYFDYNYPIMTNNAVTRIVKPTISITKGQLTLFPNPATGTVELAADFETAAPAEVRIFDRLGRLVHQESLPAGKQLRQTIQLKNLSRGMYLVQVQAGKVHLAKRLVVL